MDKRKYFGGLRMQRRENYLFIHLTENPLFLLYKCVISIKIFDSDISKYLAPLLIYAVDVK